MHKTTSLLIIATLLLAGCGGQSSNTKGDLSHNRSTAFKSMMPTYSDIRKMVNGDLAFESHTFKEKVAEFTKQAHEPFEYFQNDPNGNGDALPIIWQKPQEFQAQRDKFFAAIDQLNAAAQAGKLEDIKVAVGHVSAHCQACHESFRAPK